MRVLAFDSSGNGCSAAVVDEGGVLAHEFEAMALGQAERLVPMIARTMEAARLGFGELDCIAVTVGPGAFTGVRIGIAAAEGLALATGRPVLGLTSFETVAAAVPEALLAGRRLVVALESRREELYLQAFDAARMPLDGGALVPEAQWRRWIPASPLTLAGDGSERLEAALGGTSIERAPGSGIPDAADLGRLARARWLAGARTPRLEPLYLRAPDTTLPAAAVAGKERAS
ncbi:MAG: tRNA (adenosine(37)-N6)-threonylcarbamoyltransferase complex dimerization subunit type 1 TsaB [Acidobacteriota bacterium]